MADLPTRPFYVPGGTLPRDAPSYVERRADAELHAGLARGQFCYVLTTRQMGKSSLMVRTAARLREGGTSVAVLDLTAIGQNLNPEQWYGGLLNQLGQQLDLEDELTTRWQRPSHLNPLQRWAEAIRRVVLPRCPSRLVIFIDEIDAVRGLPFSTDEFFAAIRELYNRRAEDAALERLTFCLLGVAAPSDLIRDTRRTPFNVGARVELHDFSDAEAAPLARGLGRGAKLGAALLARVLYWTGGHPYLTQRLCQAVAERMDVTGAAGVDRLCHDLFFSRGAEGRDSNLLFVRERLLRGEIDPRGLLDLYSRVLRGRRMPDDETDPLVTALRLSGVTRTVGGNLRVRNRIYERAFGRKWVEAHTEEAELIRQRAAYRRGLWRAAVVSALVVLIVCATALSALQGWRQADVQRKAAEEQERRNKRLLYVAQMNLAQRAWEDGNVRRVVELLEAGRPQPGGEDLRGFEWYRLRRLSRAEAAALSFDVEVNSVTFSPDGRLLAVGCGDGTARLLDAAARKEVAVLHGHAGAVGAVAFSPGGGLLASGSADGTAKVWEVAGRRAVLTLEGHLNAVNCVAFSPDGEKLVTGSGDGSARVWRINNGEVIRALVGHAGEVRSVAFSPDGKSVATRSDCALKLWDARDGSEAATLAANANRVGGAGLSVSPDGKLLAESAHDEVTLWDVRARRRVRSFKESGGVPALAFSPDGTLLATGGQDGVARLRDAGSGQLLSSFKGHTDALVALAFSPDGRMFATAGRDGSVRLWDRALRQDDPLTLRGHGEYTLFAAFSPDGRRLTAGGNDARLKVWDAATGREVATLTGAGVQFVVGAFSPDGRLLATGGDHRLIRLWDADAGRELKTFAGHENELSAAAFSPDARLLATGGMDHSLKLWDIASGRALFTIRSLPRFITAVAFSPDGSTLTSFDGSDLRTWEVAGGREVNVPCACRNLGRSSSTRYVESFGSSVGIGVQDYDPDWYSVPASGSPGLPPSGRSPVPRTRGWHEFELRYEDDGLRLLIDERQVGWVPGDYGFNELRLSVSGPLWRPDAAFYFDDICITPKDTGRSFCDGFEGAGLNPFWRVREQYGAASLSSEQSHSGGQSLKLGSLPGGQRYVAVSHRFDSVTKGTVSGWFYDTAPGGQTLYAFIRASNTSAPVYAAAVSPDGSLLATSTPGQSVVRLWEFGSRRQVGSLVGHAGPINCVAFSPDGRRIATGGDDRSVKIWDVETRQEVATLKGHTDAVRFVLFSPDGSTLAAGSTGQVVRLWHAGSD